MINFTIFFPKKWNGNGITDGKIQWDLCYTGQVCPRKKREREGGVGMKRKREREKEKIREGERGRNKNREGEREANRIFLE